MSTGPAGAGAAGAGAPDDRPWLVVGLGNPGSQYARNRHNVGATSVAVLAADLGATLSSHKTRARVAEVRLPPRSTPEGLRPGPRLVLAVPTCFMNLSGGQVSGVVSFYRAELDRLLVLHDELDLPFGQLRLKRDGGEGGHNGLRSVSQSLGRRDYCRLRLGIGRPPGRMDPADFVLRDFAAAEREDGAVMVNQAADVVRDIALLGWERAQNEVNTRVQSV